MAVVAAHLWPLDPLPSQCRLSHAMCCWPHSELLLRLLLLLLALQCPYWRQREMLARQQQQQLQQPQMLPLHLEPPLYCREQQCRFCAARRLPGPAKKEQGWMQPELMR